MLADTIFCVWNLLGSVAIVDCGVDVARLFQDVVGDAPEWAVAADWAGGRGFLGNWVIVWEFAGWLERITSLLLRP